NQRYLETYFRLPEQFRSLEPVVRERIRTRLTRGKVECMLRFDNKAAFSPSTSNAWVARLTATALRKLPSALLFSQMPCPRFIGL
ncbi:hypothetical protein MJL48_31400, partial [Salmonella enterica subsp. enterica serovar Kentucky]|nr:hypothetical protein [Salmonella enterica subsp. enterica serovar Kentucky]